MVRTFEYFIVYYISALRIVIYRRIMTDYGPLSYSNEPELTKKEIEELASKLAVSRLKKSKKKSKKERINNTSRCHCGKCVPMMTAAESICCMENRGVTGDFENVLGHPLCITDEPDFQQAELNSSTLKIVWVQYDVLRCSNRINASMSK